MHSMTSALKEIFTVLLALIATEAIIGPAVLLAETPNDDRYFSQQKYDQHIRDAQFAEHLAYILFGLGSVVMVVGIAAWLFVASRKKARKRADQQRMRDTL